MAYAYRRGDRGQHCPHSDSTLERSGKNVRPRCGERNERNTMRTSWSETETTPYKPNLHHMQTVLHLVQVQKWYLSTTKWLKSTKSKKSLHAIKSSLFLPPPPKGGLSFFFLSFHFSQVDLVFIGRSPLKTENRLVRNVFVRMSLYHARA